MKIWKHFKTICRHKRMVFRECYACGIPWQGFIHDLSKFGPVEFISSAKYFQGDRSPIKAEKEIIGYSKAWLHHKGHNKHHWEYWMDFGEVDGELITNEIPVKYVVEMLCDWIGASIAYNDGKWDSDRFLKYCRNAEKSRHFHKNTLKLINEFLAAIETGGLESFHKCAKTKLKGK